MTFQKTELILSSWDPVNEIRNVRLQLVSQARWDNVTCWNSEKKKKTFEATYEHLPGSAYCFPSNVVTNCRSIKHLGGHEFSEHSHFPFLHKLYREKWESCYKTNVIDPQGEFSYRNRWHTLSPNFLPWLALGAACVPNCVAPATKHTEAVGHTHTMMAICTIIEHLTYNAVMQTSY